MRADVNHTAIFSGGKRSRDESLGYAAKDKVNEEAFIMALVKFTKVVGAGNDFIVLDNRTGKAEKTVKDLSEFAKFACKLKTSIGADGLLVLENSKKADFKMRIFNPDGTEVTMCGNGARCASLYAVVNKWCSSELKVETGAGIIDAFQKGDYVKIRMTEPKDMILGKIIPIEKGMFNVHFINTGVPHIVYFIENIDDYPVKEMGYTMRFHEAFAPEGANVNFVKTINDNSIRVRTYERGVEDETLACGTGSAASAIISHFINGTVPPVMVLTNSGDTLKVHFDVKDKKVVDLYLEGPAKIVFEGGIEYV